MQTYTVISLSCRWRKPGRGNLWFQFLMPRPPNAGGYMLLMLIVIGVFTSDWLLHISINRVWCLLLAFAWNKSLPWEDDKEAWVTLLDKLRLQALLLLNVLIISWSLGCPTLNEVLRVGSCKTFISVLSANIFTLIFKPTSLFSLLKENAFMPFFNSKLWFVRYNCV